MCFKFEMAIIYSCLIVLIFWTWPASGQHFTDCGGELSADSGSVGTITSPYFPNNYPLFSNCTWIIRCNDVGQNVVINFENFELEDTGLTDFCRFDWVSLDNGVLIGNADLGLFCGGPSTSGILPPANGIVSNESAVTINFRSDFLFNFSGFNLTYTCTGKTDSESGE
ncbi:dorsal-ventral patterning tolloid-like protein 1 isoform X2 [Mercenaria mercenaria]|uniref:dorsal-ventral patterning tolloid-like protein 1 isoform X2 n=1 Tax=Mercenaria mercenaria TaxID=6596 RepID=UPI00234E5395|nr:dorsal-ventral patterning tolloid-like protein 1 isoform X2 [Mercenaria mercenaria]